MYTHAVVLLAMELSLIPLPFLHSKQQEQEHLLEETEGLLDTAVLSLHSTDLFKNPDLDHLCSTESSFEGN